MTAPLAPLFRRRGTFQADLWIRGTAVVSLLAIAVVLWRPVIAPLVGFFLVTIFVNGPLGPLLPAAYEPVLILMGRIYHPVLVAGIGIVGIILIDWVDYYLYRAMFLHPLLEPARRSWLMRHAAQLFERSPFFAVFVCATGIFPHVTVRILAPLSGYPVERYLLATFLGRAPRLWFFAALGAALPLSTRWLTAITVGAFLLTLGIAGVRVLRAPHGATS